MKLNFTANALTAVEAALGKPLVAVLAELETEEGASLTTLRALVAAGRFGALYPKLPAAFLDEHSAGRLIDEYGPAVAAAAVGEAIEEYFSVRAQ